MALTRQAIVDAALGIIAEAGLGGFSMRRLADDLDVRVNTIYWHIGSKQELLADVGAAILRARTSADALPAGVDPTGVAPAEGISTGPTSADVVLAGAAASSRDRARSLALDLRARMLAVRDGGEIVALARALRPGNFEPTLRIAAVLGEVLGASAPAAAETVAIFVIGATIEEQNRRELVRAGASPELGDLDREALVATGLDALLRGLLAPQ